MNLVMILGIALAVSVGLNGVLGSGWIGAREDLAVEKQAFSSFRTTVKAEGAKAAKLAADTKAADEKRKKEADDAHKTMVAGLQLGIERLRNERNRAGGSLVPPAPAASVRSDLAAFDRAEFDRALRGFEEGVEGLLGEGAKAVVDLDSARRWASVR